MTKQMSIIAIQQAKTFTANAKLRSQVNPVKANKFGYYIDLHKEYGIQRVSEKLSSFLEATFTKLGFSDIQINNGGMTLSIDVRNAVIFQ